MDKNLKKIDFDYLSRRDSYFILKNAIGDEAIKELGIWGNKGSKTQIVKAYNDLLGVPEPEPEPEPQPEMNIEELNRLLDFANNDLNEAIEENDRELFLETIYNLQNETGNKNLLLEYTRGDEKIIYTLSKKFANKLEEIFDDLESGNIEEIKKTESDYDVMYNIFENDIKIEIKTIDEAETSNGGGFFNYINMSQQNLEKLQIYDYEQIEELKEIENCLINCFKVLEVPEEKIESVKNIMFSDFTPKRDLKKITEHINMNIIVKEIERKKTTSFNIGSEETITICLFKSHYFPNIKLPITRYVLKNYEDTDLRSHPMTMMNHNTEYRGNETNYTPAHLVISRFAELGLFRRDEIMNKFPQSKYIEKNKKFYLDNIDKEQTRIKKEEINNDINDNPFVFYADYETFQDDKQKPFLLGIVKSGLKKPKIFRNQTIQSIEKNDIFNLMMDYIVDCYYNEVLLHSEYRDCEPIVYFHNLKFDFNFIEKFANMKSIVKKDGQIFSAKAIHRKITIEFRDSYKMISSKLSQFKKAFKLDIGKKEYIPYTFYDKETVNKLSVPYEDFAKALGDSLEDAKPYLEPYIKFRKGKKIFRHMAYMREYLKFDCLTLMEGFNKFRKEIYNLTMIDPLEVLTSASLGDKFIRANGCYDNVYEVKGNLLNFLMEAVVGGRCCTKDNMKHILEGIIDDFDACSLYPSAMARLIEDGYGIPAGKCKRIKFKNYRYLQTLKYYVVSIRINKINKYQQIPFITYKNKDGGRDYTNIPRDDIIVVDKITLEDYIKFQEIEFEIFEGVYWTKFNTNISETIKELYDARLEAKSNGQMLKSDMLKLIMNSSYGKTLLKPSEYKTKYISKDKTKRYISKNYNQIVEMVEVGEQYRVKQYTNTFEHYNRVQAGIIILSMSKRIMNEVMNTAQDKGIKIYYQDTDSMHIFRKDIPELEKEYNRIYNKELIGKNMGQFHSDLDLNGKDAYSTKCIILGKKCYYDKIENETGTGHHIRLKGVGSRVVLAHGDPEELYMRMYNGEEIEFDLCKGSVKFKQNKNNIEVLKKFIRRIKF